MRTINQRSTRTFGAKSNSLSRFFGPKECGHGGGTYADAPKRFRFATAVIVLLVGTLPGQAAAQGASVSDLRLVEASPEKQTAILQDPRSQQELELRTNDIIGDFQVVLIEADAITLEGPNSSDPLVLWLSPKTAKPTNRREDKDKPAPSAPSQRPEKRPTEIAKTENDRKPTPPVKPKDTSLEVKNPYAPPAESPDKDEAAKSKTGAKKIQSETKTAIVDPEAPVVENHRITRRQLDAALSDFQKLEKQIRITPTGEEIVVDYVKAKSLPFRLGIRKGDRIQTVAGAQLTSTQAAADAYVALTSAKAFDITLLRGKTPVTLRCTVK